MRNEYPYLNAMLSVVLLTLFYGSAGATIPLQQELLKTIKQSTQEKVTGKSTTTPEEEIAIGRQIAGNLLGHHHW